MTLAAGSKLGPYEIVGPLGSGGMGEVYRARDTRLERTVAIKILPASISADPMAKQRFEREAKTISGLNHPNICTLHDVGSQDGVDYLVMECVEGETLGKRLEKGPLPLEQVLKYGAQIADALDKAHRAGIVHRDLKPGNIMLASNGAKLLDFGLAKPAALLSGATMTAVSPTSPVTQEGTIVGTFQYMSPEQVEGKEVDRRSDIFSLGAVLYEMLTGKKAFEGKSQLSVASAILEKEPAPIASIKPLTPPPLDHIIQKCLAKWPEERWQTAADLASELKWIAGSGSQVSFEQTTTKPGSFWTWRAATPWAICLFSLVALVAFFFWNQKPTVPAPVSRFVITLPPGQKLAGLNQPAVALSADGSLLAYVAVQNGVQQVYLRPLNSLESRPVPGTDGAVNPFFSPDGRWLGFFADSKVKKVAVTGGTAVTLADAAFPGGAVWNSQGVIAFSPRSPSPLLQVSEAGGATQPLTRMEKGETTHRWPEFLPGGKAVLFAGSGTSFAWDNAQVAVQSLAAGERSNLVQGAVYPRFAYSGHLIFQQSGSLFAVPFDPQRLAVTGKAVPVVETVLRSTTTGATQFSNSNNGTLVYVSGGTQTDQRTLVWVNRNGVEQPLPAPPHAYLFPRISPEGRRVAVAITGNGAQIWIYDLSRDTLTRFTFEGDVNLNSVWTPDGQRVVFQNPVSPGSSSGISWQRADGSGGSECLFSRDSSVVPISMSSDGQFLAFIDVNPATSNDIWILRMSDRTATPFLRTPFTESVPQFSPDGHWLSYISNESGRFEIYVQPYPGPGGKYQISTEGGTEPSWNPNGREIFYRNSDRMMAVDITTHPGFSAGKPHMLFQGRYNLSPVTSPNYSVSPDGQRFLMLKSVETAEGAPTQINVVLNWFEELKQRVPLAQK
jgi:eukaryotic-like serine/threonine-protein kinase